MTELPLEIEPPGAPQFASELDEAILLGHVQPEVAERFRVKNLGEAEWAMKRRKALADERKRVEAQHDAWVQPYDDWLAGEHERIGRGERVLDALLETYALEVRAADEHHKTISLPSGEVATTKPKQMTVHVAEGREDDVIAWCEKSLDPPALERVVQTTKKLNKAELKKIVQPVKRENGSLVVVDPTTGSFVPGMYAREPGPTTATVKPAN